jgi:predicted GH43/DUF377 family glycosyl hydrolase
MKISHLILRIFLGKKWKDRTWVSRQGKNEILDEINIFSANLLKQKYSLRANRIPIESKYPAFNPSIKSNNLGYTVLARSSSVVCLNDGNYYPRTKPDETTNFLIELDTNYQKISQTILNQVALDDIFKDKSYQLQDCRLFDWNDSTWLIGAIIHPGTYRGSEILYSTQCLCKLEDSKLISATLFQDPSLYVVEKNWVPIIIKDQLKLIYSFSPFVILDPFNLDTKLIQTIRCDFRIRGGTPFIQFHGNYLGLVHSAPMKMENRLFYTHQWILINEDLEIIETSDPFFFEKKGIEFACGLIKTINGVLVSYGVGDRICSVMEISDEIIFDYITG